MRRWATILIALAAMFLMAPGAARAAAKPPVDVPAGSRVVDLVVMGQDVTIAGRVDGNVTVLFGDLHLTPTAVVRHDVAVVGGTLTRDAGADLHGDIFTLRAASDVLAGLGWGLATYGLLSGLKLLWITATVAVALLWALRPRRPTAATQPSLWRLLAYGLLWAVVAVLVAGALCFTLWGIPFALGLALVAVGISCLGTGMLAVRVGEWALDLVGQQRPRWQTGGLGSLLLVLPTGVPILGLAALALVMVAGLGQFVAAIARR